MQAHGHTVPLPRALSVRVWEDARMTTITPDDERWMDLALAEAKHALATDDVPVGAVVIGPDGAVVGRGHNAREAEEDPTAHAELSLIHISEPTRLGMISYAVFCLKK